jgi:hypothetical protein
MSADEIPTTIAALIAERDRKISGWNAGPGSERVDFFRTNLWLRFIPQQ